MVSLEDSLEDRRGRRTRGSKQDSGKSAIEMPVGVPAHDLEVPTELLRRAINSAMIGGSDTERSGLMEYLHAQDGDLNKRSQILIDTALANKVPCARGEVLCTETVPERTTEKTQIRVYDLGKPGAAAIRDRIKTLPLDAHSVLLTLRR